MALPSFSNSSAELAELKELLDSKPLTEKGHVQPEVRDAFFKKIRQSTANRICFDCPARNPVWLSLPFGTFICLDCSGEHRRLGTHLSFVRSIDMDKFYPHQLAQVAMGGNAKIREEFKKHGITGKRKDTGGQRVDYFSKTSQKIYAQLEKNCEAQCEKTGIPCKAGTASSAPLTNASPDEATLLACSPQPEADAAPAAPEVKAAYPGITPMKPMTATGTKPMTPMKPTGVDRAKSAGGGMTPMQPTAERAVSAPIVADPMAIVSDTSVKAVAPAPNFAAPAQPKATKKLDDDFEFDFDDLEKEINSGVPAKPAPAPAPKKFAPLPATVATGYPAQMGIPIRDDGESAAPAQAKVEPKPNGAHSSWQEEEEARIRMQKFKNAGAISSDAFFGLDEDESPSGRIDYGALKDKVADKAGNALAMGKNLLGTGIGKLREYRAGS
jgi:ADP-ribosylation factor GTPase-activating protein 2/3